MRFNKLKVLLFLCTLLSFLSVQTVGYADSLDTQLSSDKVALGDTLTISFALNSNSKNTSPDFSALENDFHILGKNYGNAINRANGVTTRQTFWQLTLQPKKAGIIIIPEIDFGSVKSTSRELIVEETAKPVIKDSQDASAFVQAEVSTLTPYVQSQVLYTFKLFYQSQLENPKLEIPQIKDATFIQIGDGNQYKTTVKGKPYFVVEKHFAFFPEKVGKLSIPSFHFSALTYDTNSSTAYDPFYNIVAAKGLALSTQILNLTVKKIPEQFKGTTWLPAKNISLTESWSVDPGRWELGNPVVRTITIEAKGLRADQIPDLSIDKIPGVNTYVDPPKRSSHIQDNSMVGTLEQKVTYIPNITDSFSIPVLKLNWWNTQTNKNAIAQLNAITVQAKGKVNNLASTAANSSSITAAVDTSDTSNQATDVSLTKSAPQAIVNSTPFYLLIWFWIAVFVFAAWLVTLWFIWNKRTIKKGELTYHSPRAKTAVPAPMELSEKSFIRACQEGNAVLAQQYLLSWVKTQREDNNINLMSLYEMTRNDNFKESLENLERAIYSNKVIPWDGHSLLVAYQQVKKQWKNNLFTPNKSKSSKGHKQDPLPPLNPSI